MSTPFRHILLTLDGSRLSEVALPIALELARISDASLTLFHVVERDAPATIHGDRHLQTGDEATAYLDVLAERLQQQGIAASAVVRFAESKGRVAETIAAEIQTLGCDLVILASHGEGGIRELLFGRVAQRIIQLSSGPLIVVPATRGDRPYQFGVLALPLDGSPEAEIVLPIASALAGTAESRVVLIRVVPTPGDLQGPEAAVGTLLPGATAASLNFEVDDARRYLGSVAATWFPHREVTIDIRRGPIDAEIRKSLTQYVADLVLMGTHGRGGLTARLEGSLGAQLLSATPCPLLLIRFQS